MYTRYQHIVIEDADERPSEGEIASIEYELGAKLPYDFLNFLDVANGGCLVDYYVTVPVSTRSENIRFNSILTTKRMEYGSFLGELELHRSPEQIFQIPGKILPFAQSRDGSYLYLDLRDSLKNGN